MKCDEVQASKRGCVFILFSDVFSQKMPCDVERSFRQIVLRNRVLQVCAQGLEDVDTDASGRSKARAWRNFRGEEQIYCDITIHLLQHCQRNFQRASAQVCLGDIVPSLEDAEIGGNYLYPAIGPRSEYRVEILIDRDAQDRPAELLIIRRQIGATATETNPHWTATVSYTHLRAH